MFFITYSQNVLHLVLALCAICLTVAITVFFYYVILAAKDIRTTTETIQKRVADIEAMINSLKNNFGIGLTVLNMVKEAALSAKDFFIDRDSKSPKSKGKSS